MKTKLPSLIFLTIICLAGWYIGGRLSSDALGLALGVIFGLMAGIPAALIALAATNRAQPPAQPAAQPPPLLILGVATSQPTKQIIEHRHVHVHVGKDSQAPPKVREQAAKLQGIPVQINATWWAILEPATRKVLLEMRQQHPRQLEIKS